MIKTHIAELQSARGIAAMAVLIGHSLDYYDTPKWFWHLSLVFNGRAAVVVFFVLSGFVLTRSLAEARFDRGTLLRAAFYAGEVAATILAEAVDLESAADAVEERNAFPDPLRPGSDLQASAS